MPRLFLDHQDDYDVHTIVDSASGTDLCCHALAQYPSSYATFRVPTLGDTYSKFCSGDPGIPGHMSRHISSEMYIHGLRHRFYGLG